MEMISKKKRIITCTDGTWNRPGITDKGTPVRSNVELIFNCIPAKSLRNGVETRQVKFYETGVGSSTFDLEDKVLGGIEGAGLDQKIKNVYAFLTLNYEPGDDIFLFGFSRGAYTARSVAGFIRNCGILKHENLQLLDYAYTLYRDRNEYSVPDSDFMTSFREKFCVELNTKIKFIGVWDTVGSLGLPFEFSKGHNAHKYKFHDVKLSSYIENAYHALAIDERRKLFEPTLWEVTESGKRKNQHVEQRWFTGVHCNVGGGYKDTGLSDLALNWLIDKAKGVGLDVNDPSLADNANYTYKPNYKGILRNSLTLMYWFWPPQRRVVAINNRTKKVGDKEVKIITEEKVDESVVARLHDSRMKYRPGNLEKIHEQICNDKECKFRKG